MHTCIHTYVLPSAYSYSVLILEFRSYSYIYMYMCLLLLLSLLHLVFLYKFGGGRHSQHGVSFKDELTEMYAQKPRRKAQSYVLHTTGIMLTCTM